MVGRTDKADDPESSGTAGAGTTAIDDDTAPADLAAEREKVRAIGGLYILGTERHESRRIDNQLRGRSGRQGDPGASRFHVSLEDFLWRAFGDRSNSMLMRQWEEDQSVDMPILSRMIENAQKKVEQHNFDARKHVLEYDDVMNVQREVIYGERRRILKGEDLRETLLGHLHETVDASIMVCCPEGTPPDEWERGRLLEEIGEVFPVGEHVSPEQVAELTRADLSELLHGAADAAWERKETELTPEVMRDIERYLMRQAIDQAWIAHLSNMDYLREGIGLRGYAQMDPLVAYKKEALELFNEMQRGLVGDTVRQLFLAQLQTEMPDEQSLYDLLLQGMESGPGVAVPDDEPSAVPLPDPQVAALLAAAAEAAQNQPVAKIDPNDPCPCGSGKKYKACHRGKPLP